MQTTLLLDMAADAMKGRAAVGAASTATSFGDLRARVQAGASFLAARPGEAIAFLGENSATLPILLFSSGYAGRSFAPLNYRLADEDLNRLIARAAPCTLVLDDDMLDRVRPTLGVEVVTKSLFDQACEGSAVHLGSEAHEQSNAVVLFTSGTTGTPKAAVLKHSNLTSYVISTVEFMSAGADEAALISVPPYHIASISAALTNVYAGRRIVYLTAFSPEAWVSTAISEGITHAMVVPTMLSRILEVLEARGETLTCLRVLSYGGGRMPLSVIERALQRMPHVDFVNAYGLTETSSTIALLDAENHRLALASADPAARRRLGSVGRPLQSVTLEIRAPDGRLAGPGEAGEVWVRGDQVSGAYLGVEAGRQDGWFRTNDRGWLDEAGYLFIDGRLDDVIVRGGENISPGEIEDALRMHANVADVAVFGAPDDEWGEKVVAVVVARQPVEAQALQAWVRSRLRSAKAPAEIHFRTELPYNDMGKLLRRVLRSEYSTTYRSHPDAPNPTEAAHRAAS